MPYLANSAPTEQVHDREQDHCTQERHTKSRETQVALIDGRSTDQRADQPAAEQRADDTDDDVQQNALLPIGPHHQTREPPNHTTNHQPDQNVHIGYPLTFHPNVR